MNKQCINICETQKRLNNLTGLFQLNSIVYKVILLSCD